MVSGLDKIDFLVLQKLIEDGRASFSAIARDTNLTDVAIKKRVERLKRRGIIKSITANLNYKVLGFENPILVQLRTEIGKNKEVLKKLNEMDSIIELSQVLGEYNIIAKLIIPSLDNAEKMIEKLGFIDGVIDVKSMVVLSQLKNSNTLPTQGFQKKL